MRSFFTIVLIWTFSLSLFANDEAKELRMRIIGALAHTVTEKEYPVVYVDDEEFKNFDVRKFGFVLTKNCSKSDVIFTKNISLLLQDCFVSNDKKLFVLSYRDYIKNEQKVIGAFFWQKGRPNIILNKELLKKYSIKVPKDYEKYIE